MVPDVQRELAPRGVDRIAAAFVLVVWGLATVAALAYVYLYIHDVPRMDDYSFVDVVTGNFRPSFGWFWSQHNEHRIVVPRLVMIAALWASGGDFRAGGVVQILILSGLSLFMVRRVAQLRGRASMTDAFFPLLCLHWGHAPNWIMGFQVAVVLPAALFTCIALEMLARRDPPRARRSMLMALATVALILCGASGLVLAPFVIVWLALAGVSLARRGCRRDARAAGAGALLATLTIVVYVLGLSGGDHLVLGARVVAQNTITFLTNSLGWAAVLAWPASGALVALVLGAVAGGLAAAAFRDPSERLPAAGGLLAMLAVAALGASIGMARSEADLDEWYELPVTLTLTATALLALCGVLLGAGVVGGAERARMAAAVLAVAGVVVLGARLGLGRRQLDVVPALASRYVVLAAPVLAVAYACASARFAPERDAVARWVLFLTLCATAVPNTRYGIEEGEVARASAEALVSDVLAQKTSWELALAHSATFLHPPSALAVYLSAMRSAGVGPFGLRTWDVNPDDPTFAGRWGRRAFSMFQVVPLEITSTQEQQAYFEGNTPVYIAMPDSAVVLELPAGVRSVSGTFGLVRASYMFGESDGARFSVEFQPDGGEPQLLFERTLDPLNVEEDRARQSFDVTLPEGASGRVVLRTGNEPGKNGASDGTYWTDVGFSRAE